LNKSGAFHQDHFYAKIPVRLERQAVPDADGKTPNATPCDAPSGTARPTADDIGRNVMSACGSGKRRASFGQIAASKSVRVRHASVATACETIACGARSGIGMPIAFEIVT